MVATEEADDRKAYAIAFMLGEIQYKYTGFPSYDDAIDKFHNVFNETKTHHVVKESPLDLALRQVFKFDSPFFDLEMSPVNMIGTGLIAKQIFKEHNYNLFNKYIIGFCMIKADLVNDFIALVIPSNKVDELLKKVKEIYTSFIVGNMIDFVGIEQPDVETVFFDKIIKKVIQE
jgi:hypothetical protein